MMKISKSLLSAIATGIVMTAATSCDKTEVVEIEHANTEVTEPDRGNNNGWCGTGSNTDNCPGCGMG